MLTVLVKAAPANNTNKLAPLMSTDAVYVIGVIDCVGVMLGVGLGDPVELWVFVLLCDDVVVGLCDCVALKEELVDSV